MQHHIHPPFDRSEIIGRAIGIIHHDDDFLFILSLIVDLLDGRDDRKEVGRSHGGVGDGFNVQNLGGTADKGFYLFGAG